jgi:hypothetical protein
MNNQSDLALVLATAREMYGRVVWTHKVHEIERELLTKKLTILNWYTIGAVFSTVVWAIIGSVFTPYVSASRQQLITAVLTAGSACLVIAQTMFNPADKEAQQRAAAKEVLCLREDLLLLIMNCQSSTADVPELKKSLENITRELTRAYRFMPNTSSEANAITGKRLGRGEMTFSDEEIDSFLPTEMRKKKFQITPTADTGATQLPKASGQD